jgi:uncharacterized membrane protein
MSENEKVGGAKRKFKDYAFLAFCALLFGPAAIIWIGGLVFGEAIVDLTDSKIFGHWFMISLMAMAIFALSGGLFEQIKRIKAKDKTRPSSPLEIAGLIAGLILVLYFLYRYLENHF